MKHTIFLSLLALGLGFSAISGCKKAPEAAQPAEIHSARGVIKEFGAGNKTLTIQHGAFTDGFMEAMTMSFELQDAKLADGLKVGDKVDFSLQHIGQAFPIISIKKVAN